ncbi:hypothetical protein [Streptomyces sp. bgisy100]|uniref:hypothetical protein n=1 Tax=Streptomyces sp. bgisy100 TaxID=3413783 RepID=UPI003D7469B5
MSRRSLPAAAALAAAGTLLLTACGGGDTKTEEQDRIAGAQDTKKQNSPSPRTPAPGRPKIELPEDVKLTFTPEKTGDATKDAVLADSAERIRAVDAAITGTDPKYRGLNYYSTGRALQAGADWVQQFKKAKQSMTGTIRYFDRKVTIKNSETASLIYCADESKGYSKDLKTGKPEVTPVTDKSFVVYNTTLEKNGAGVWQTSRIISQRGASQCRR